MARSLNSSVGKLQSLSKALVSTSALPIGPSSSTRVPNGCKDVLLDGQPPTSLSRRAGTRLTSAIA